MLIAGDETTGVGGRGGVLAGNNNTNNIVYCATTDVRASLVYNDFIVVLTEGDFQRVNTENFDSGRTISLADVHVLTGYYDNFVINHCFRF